MEDVEEDALAVLGEGADTGHSQTKCLEEMEVSPYL
jgi:hypothetical protein